MRKFGAWRRRSEPCHQETSLAHQTETESSTSKPGQTRDEPGSGTLEVEIADASRVIADPEPAAPPPQQQQPPRMVPESLERIVEQLVLQNVEIQRILQRKKRRAIDRQPSTSSRPCNRSESTTMVDEGIYDTLLMASPAVGGTADADGDYVTIRGENGGHFSRCHLRRSLGSKTPDRMVDSPQVTNSHPLQSLQKATLSRSLSCPARGQQAVRLAKKSETSHESGSTVGGRIQKLLNQIGSPDHWSNWIRSLSPPQRQAEPDVASSSRSRSRREPIELDVDPMNASTSPCVPSVWLQMQSEHLAEPAKKSGSLPRSFQVSINFFERRLDHHFILD